MKKRKVIEVFDDNNHKLLSISGLENVNLLEGVLQNFKFSKAGVIKTSDGREIRTYEAEYLQELDNITIKISIID